MTTSHTSTTTDTTHAVLSQDGAKISYLTMGSGPSVLVIPGALSMAADYAAFASALAEHFTVHIIERLFQEPGLVSHKRMVPKHCTHLLVGKQQVLPRIFLRSILTIYREHFQTEGT